MKKHRTISIYLVLLLVLSIVAGIFYGSEHVVDIKDYLTNLNGHNNIFLIHLLAIIFMLFTTVSCVGVLSSSLLISFNGMSIGYIIYLFYKQYKIKGLLYALLTSLINNGVYILLLCYLFYVSLTFSIKFMKNIIGKKHDYISLIFKPLLLKYFIVILVMILYDTFIYFFGNNLLNSLKIML